MKLSRGLLAVLFLSAFAISTLAIDARAQYSPWGAAADTVSVANDGLGLPGATGDGSNGLVVAWSSDETQLVYAKRYSQTGSVVWGPVEVGPIEATTDDEIQVVRQGSSWFVAWFDPHLDHGEHFHFIRVAKLNSSGSVVATDEILLSGTPADVSVNDLAMVPRTGGGVAICYTTIGESSHFWLFASDLSSDFEVYYVSADLVRIVADGSDGVYAIWGSGVYPPFVKAQRYDSSGYPQWDGPLTVLNYSGGEPITLDVSSDGNGGFLAASEWYYNLASHVRVQRVASDESTFWNDSGVSGKKVCPTCPEQIAPHIIVNSANTAAVVSWEQTSGGGRSIQAQQLVFGGTFGAWGTTGIQVNVSGYSYVGEHHLVQNINKQTAVAWTYQNYPYNDILAKFQIIGDDGDVELDADAGIGGTVDPYNPPRFVQQSVGVYAAFRMYVGDDIWLWVNSSVPALVYDIQTYFNEEHCSNHMSWKTLPGTTANKVKYRHIGASTWQSKNGADSSGTWVASVPQYVPIDYKFSATTSGAWETGVFQDYGGCDEPDPQGAPMADVKRATEAYLTAHPNPFNPQVSVDYGVPALSRVDLAIFDASGRRIKTLVSGTKSPGSYSEIWDGNNDRGDRVASGVYFSRLTVNGKTMTHKIVMLK